MKIGFTIALLAVAVLCFSAIAQEQNAKYWYEKGLKLNANQSYDEAVQAYDNAIKLDPGKPEYWDGKALTLYFLHRNLEATESWKKALQLYNNTLVKNPKDADAWMGKGHIFANLAMSDKADLRESYGESELNAYEQGLEISPQNSTMLYFKGSALFKLKRYNEAIAALDQALKIGFDPKRPWMTDGASQLKGLAEAALGKKNESAQSYQESLKGFDEAIRKANLPQNLSEAWAEKGMVLQEQGNYNESIKAFDNATNVDPKNQMAWQIKGFMQARWMGRYQEGLAALDKALDIRPTADVWEAKARVFVELGMYDEAINASEQALSLNRNLNRTWLDKGGALLGLGRYQEALDTYARAEDTYDEQLFAGEGFALAGLNRSNEAIAAFNKSLNASQTVLEEDNKSAYGWFWKGEALRGLGRYQEALDAYNLSLENGKDYAISSWRSKGYALKALGHQAETEIALARAKELGYDTSIGTQEKTADYWFKHGRELLGNGSVNEGNEALDKAQQLYNDSIKQNPKDANAWLGKGNVLAMRELSGNNLSAINGTPALAAYDQVLKIDPKNIDALISKGFVLFEMGFADKKNHNRSLEALDKALQIDPKNPRAWDFKGTVLFAIGKYNDSLEADDKAIENIDIYTEGYPGYRNRTEVLSELWLSKGFTLQQVGRINESLKAFDKADSIYPGNYDAWMFKGQALDRMGKYNDSANAFENASKALPPLPKASVSSFAFAWISKADVLVNTADTRMLRQLTKKPLL